MNLEVKLHGSLPAPVLDVSVRYRGEIFGATLEATEAREGHCASRISLIDTAVRHPDGYFDVPLSDRQIDEAAIRKALAIILKEHFDDDLAAYPLKFTP